MTDNDARAVVITGAGVVSPLGHGCAANAAGLRGGHSGIRPIAAFDAQGFPVRCAGEVPGAELPPGAGRPEALARRALAEALGEAGLATAADPRRALSFAIGKPTLDLAGLARGRARWQAQGDPARALEALPHLEAERVAAEPPALLERLAHAAGAAGPRFACYTACASGNDAIGLGLRLIQRGEAEVVVTGATDCQVHPLSLLEFELLSALSHETAERACRPFDRARTGFVVGEGAAVLVLEAAAHARRRGARPLARLAGYGSSLDAFGLTKCHPQGRGAAQAMRAALDDAGLVPGDVDYLNAHGTGTVLNDAAEAAALHQVWGEAVRELPVSSTKSLTGHLLTAASAVEAVLTLLALREGFLPPNLNYETPDPDCALQVVAQARPAAIDCAMSNGFGFGGQNSALILAREPS